jgi:hypothetical protein
MVKVVLHLNALAPLPPNSYSASPGLVPVVCPGVRCPDCRMNLGGYQDRLLGGPLGLPNLCCTAPDGVKHKDCGGEVLG